MNKQLEIRNSTAEFLIFQAEGQENGIQVVYKDETIWCTQKAMAALFDVDRSVITKHLKNIFELNELNQDAVCAIFAHTAEDGKTYNTQFYNLDAIISVGYRVNSLRATQFRQWCTYILRQNTASYKTDCSSPTSTASPPNIFCPLTSRKSKASLMKRHEHYPFHHSITRIWKAFEPFSMAMEKLMSSSSDSPFGASNPLPQMAL